MATQTTKIHIAVVIAAPEGPLFLKKIYHLVAIYGLQPKD
jgi:hypothetical protein